MIHRLTMPKWGLSMTEGKVVAWLAEDGAEVSSGAEVVEVETEKIASGLHKLNVIDKARFAGRVARKTKPE